MIEQLRTPFFFAALAALLLVLLLETGSGAVLGGGESDVVNVGAAAQMLEDLGVEQTERLTEAGAVSSQESQPGWGIFYLVLIDGILLFTVVLITLGLFVPERIQGRVQGIATFVFSLLLGGTSVGMAFAAVAELTLMVSLLLSAPFGTIAYMATYAPFDRGGAAVALSVLVALKFAFSVLLILAQQRFLQNKGLVVLLITSFVATILVSFLHGLVPLFLVSITDAIAAIIIAVLAAAWALVLLFGSVKSVARAVGL